jgi:hypothetical protein
MAPSQTASIHLLDSTTIKNILSSELVIRNSIYFLSLCAGKLVMGEDDVDLLGPCQREQGMGTMKHGWYELGHVCQKIVETS